MSRASDDLIPNDSLSSDGIYTRGVHFPVENPTSYAAALRENERLRRDLAAACGDRDEMHRRFDERGVEVQSLKAGWIEAQNEVQRLTVEIESLKDANDRLQDELEVKSKEAATWEREVNRLRHQNGEARQPGEPDKLRADLRHMDGQLSAAGEVIAGLRQEQARLQSRVRELESQSQNIRLLRKAIRALAKLR